MIDEPEPLPKCVRGCTYPEDGDVASCPCWPGDCPRCDEERERLPP